MHFFLFEIRNFVILNTSNSLILSDFPYNLIFFFDSLCDLYVFMLNVFALWCLQLYHFYISLLFGL